MSPRSASAIARSMNPPRSASAIARSMNPPRSASAIARSMNPQRVRLRHRMNVILQMVTALIAAILLGQLWLFTVTIETIENGAVSTNVAIAATTCSLLASIAVWTLIRFFLKTESEDQL